MSVTTTNLIMGPATVYKGNFGAAEPTDANYNTAPAASAYADVGGTMGGLTLTINQTYTELDVDQIVDIPERRLTKRDIQLATSFAEATLQNLQNALNGGTVVTGSGATPNTYDPANTTSATQPAYSALIIDGWAPGQFRRRVIVRKVLSIQNVAMDEAKDKQTVIPVTFGAHYVSNAITPFHVVDGNQ